MRKLFTITVCLLLSAAPVAAQGTGLLPSPEEPTTRVGTRGANFLTIGVGARAQALGNAYTAIATGVDALYWNSAGITELDGFAGHMTFAQLYDDLDISHSFVGVVLPTSFANLGVSVLTLNSGDIPRTTINYPDGDDPTFGSSYEWTSLAVGLHAGKRITDRMAVGLAGKIIQEGMEGASASFVAADVGLIFRTGLYGITLGASLQNVGTTGNLSGQLVRDNLPARGNQNRAVDTPRQLPYDYHTVVTDLPTNFHFSIATDLVGGADALLAPNPNHSVTVITDLADATDTDIQPSLGVEYNFNDFVFVRGGKRWLNEQQITHDFGNRLSFGGGLALPLGGDRQVMLDYAYTDFGELNNVQVFSVEAQF